MELSFLIFYKDHRVWRPWVGPGQVGSDSQPTSISRCAPGNAQVQSCVVGNQVRGPFRVGVAGLSRKASWRKQPSLSVERVGENIRRDLRGARSRLPGQGKPLSYILFTPPSLDLSGVLLIGHKLHERQTLLPTALMVHLVARLKDSPSK